MRMREGEKRDGVLSRVCMWRSVCVEVKACDYLM